MLRRHLDKEWRAWRAAKATELKAHLKHCPPDDPRYQRWARSAIRHFLALCLILSFLMVLGGEALWKNHAGWATGVCVLLVCCIFPLTNRLAMNAILAEEEAKLDEYQRSAEGSSAEAGALTKSARAADRYRRRIEGGNSDDGNV